MNENRIIDVPWELIDPNPYQPESRVAVSDEIAETFGKSILEHGLLQLPVCRGVNAIGRTIRYEMGDGWLRRAGFVWLSQHGHPEFAGMPVQLRDFTDLQMADLVLEANTVRQDLNPIDLAWYYRKYLADFKQVTQAEFARRHNKSQAEVSNTMRLLELPEEVRDLIISREISGGHGRALLQLKEPSLISEYAGRAVEHSWSVANLDAAVKGVLENRKPRLAMEAAAETEPEPEPEAYGDEKQCPYNETITCHKMVCENCENIPENIPPQGETVTPETETPAASPVPVKTEKVTPPMQPPAAKTKAPTPPPSPTPKLERPVAASGEWVRKLSISEYEGYCTVSYMVAGGMPVMKKLEGVDLVKACDDILDGKVDGIDISAEKEAE